MRPEYDIFEKLSDGSSNWRVCVPGQYEAECKLQELAEHSENEFFAIEINSRKLQPFIVLRSSSREQIASRSVDTVPFAVEGPGVRSGGQSGDLQGLSNVQGADSESVDELLQEGNAFEAEVVKGVEDAGDADEGEVNTHEVLQDDVPGEYLDRD
jgi:hypothetical protein